MQKISCTEVLRANRCKRLNCSLQALYGVEAFIFVALALSSLIPLFLRFLWFFDLLDFTIWVSPAVIVEVSRPLDNRVPRWVPDSVCKIQV